MMNQISLSFMFRLPGIYLSIITMIILLMFEKTRENTKLKSHKLTLWGSGSNILHMRDFAPGENHVGQEKSAAFTCQFKM